MTNIYLYGELRNLFGHEFRYNISKPREAFTAINANRRGFLTALKKLAAKGVFYRIVIDDQVIEDPLELDIVKAPQEIHLVPVVWGAGDSVKNILLIVAAVALIAISGGFAAFGAPAGLTLLSGTAAKIGLLVGGALLTQGVMGLLFPTPKPDFNQEVSAGGKSYLFGSKPSNTSQGQAVPVGYGRLIIGSSQISASINNYRLNYDVKALMTPTSRPVEVIPAYEGIDELEIDGYRSNQTAVFEDAVSVVDVSLSQSYVDIVTKSAKKVSSNIIELRVKQDGEIISNPNLSTYNEDLTYKWTQLSSSDSAKSAIKQENSYSFSEGALYRFARPQEFQLISNAAQSRTDSNYMILYPTNSLVIWGPTQFEALPKSAWDNNTQYVSGEIVTLASIFFRCTTNIPANAVISAASRSGATVTITTSANHGFSSNFKASISGLSKGNVNANGYYSITVTAANQFTYTLATSDTKTETYTVTNGSVALNTHPALSKSYIASATRSNAVVTITLGNSATPFNPIVLSEITATSVQIANLSGTVDPNGTYTITRVNDTTFTYTLSGSPSGSETYTVVTEDADILDQTKISTVTKLFTSGVNNFWSLFIPPIREQVYRATSNSQGKLPTDGAFWTAESIPTASGTFDTYLSYVKLPINQSLYTGDFSAVNISEINNNASDVGNYTLEFLGYFYIPLNKNTDIISSDPLAVREISVISANSATVYEITKVGTAAQWSTIGVGSVPPVVGMTFTKNATAATGNGKVAPVNSYDFKIECLETNDAFADLYINGILASSHDENSSPVVNAVTLTTGYHRVYARLRTGVGRNKIKISYRKTGAASFTVVGENQLLNRKTDSNLIALNSPIYTQRGDIAASSMVAGKKYRINVVGTAANWTSVGATSATVGTVFLKNSTAFSGTGAFASEVIDLAAVQADSQRLVTFTSEREDTGYAKYVSFWQCEITKGVSRYLSPTIRVGVTFLSTQNESIERSVPPIQALPSIF